MKQLFYLIAAFIVGYITAAILLPEHKQTEPKVETITVYDTVLYYYPVARDSVVVRYETHRLPMGGDKSPKPEQKGRDSDSVEVIVPITQKEYKDSTYHAWVSGYAVKLDSINIFTRQDYTRVTLPLMKHKRWHLGVTAGYAVTPKGVQPYIGAGITYSFYSF